MPFSVTPYSQRAFFDCLKNDYLSALYIQSNLPRFGQAEYIAGYLDHLNAKTIVVENEYIDRDYMADYSSYYASCYDEYGSQCRRLHFFDSNFNQAALDRLIKNPDKQRDKNLNKHYLGFVVVRPLPEAIIGRTLLKTYSDTGADRHYRAIREYDVNLFGISLTVNSLAYQQQDTVVAACATVALWSAFHKTSQLFHHPLFRPTEITIWANLVQGGGRAMPSAGLRVEQICAAIRRTGLEPLAEEINQHTTLMSMLYGYLAFGLPVIVLGAVAECGYAGHAVTITGYSLASKPTATREKVLGGVLSVGQRIEKLYIHDDNLGPFARTLPVPIPSSAPREYQDAPFALQYSEAHAWAGKMVFLMSRLGITVADLEWQIGLTTVQSYKRLIREKYARSTTAQSLLTTSLPRFMWRALAVRGKREVFELLIDATGVSRSCPVLALLWHNATAERDYRSRLKQVSKNAVTAAYGQRFADIAHY